VSEDGFFSGRKASLIDGKYLKEEKQRISPLSLRRGRE
jgi:hypothetical protein